MLDAPVGVTGDAPASHVGSKKLGPVVIDGRAKQVVPKDWGMVADCDVRKGWCGDHVVTSSWNEWNRDSVATSYPMI
jgi:hypothetical protein